MSFFTEEEISDARSHTYTDSEGRRCGIINGIKGRFDSEYNLIEGEEYETSWSFHASKREIESEASRRQAEEVEDELRHWYDKYHEPGPDDSNLLVDILVLPFALLLGGIDSIRLISKTIKKEKAKLQKEALKEKKIEDIKLINATPNKKIETPWFLKRIDDDIRFHEYQGSDFYDYCVYQHGLRNGLGIMNFDSGVTRIGFYQNGLVSGESIRFGTDGSRLIGIDQKGWTINGRFLRIYEKDHQTYSLIEIYKDGKLIDTESPKENESLVKYRLDNGVAYRSEGFAYQESYLDDGSILYYFLNKVGLRLSIKVYPNGDKAISRWNNGVQYGYCIVEPKNESPFVRYMDNLIALKTIKLEEKDDGKVDTPWYLKRINYDVKFHKHQGIDFYDYSIYQKGLRDGLGVIYFKGDIKRTGFFKDGFLCGQSIREYPDGSKLVGVDQKEWSMNGRYLRILKDYRTRIETYQNGKLVKTEDPNEKEKMYFSKRERGTTYYSETFNYGEFVYLDGTATKMFLNEKGLRLVVRNFADGRVVSAQFIDGVQKGYCIIESKDNPPICRLMDDSNILKTLQLEEIDK